MNRIYAIALTAFRESLRDRILFAVLGLGAVSLFFGLSLGAISYNEATRILVDHGLVTISLLSNLIAIFLGANFLYKELELRTLYVLLARPISRRDVVVGKFLGILLSVAVFVLLTASLLFILLAFTATDDSAEAARRAHILLGTSLSFAHNRIARIASVALVFVLTACTVAFPRVRKALGVGALVPVSLGLFIALGLVSNAVVPAETRLIVSGCVLALAEVSITAAFSMLFSSFSTPFVTGMLSAGTFVICRSTWLMQHLRLSNLPMAVRAGLNLLAKVIPNLHLFVPERPILLPGNTPAIQFVYLGECGVYALAYAAVILAGAVLLFRRRDLV